VTEETKPATDEQEESKNGNVSSGAAENDNPMSGTVEISKGEYESLQKQSAERDEFLNLAKRTQADFQNYQTRMQREREQDRQFYAGAMILELLPVLDNLQRAINASKDAGESSSLVQGVNMVQNQFLELLKRHGVKPIDAAGKPFDPNMHEALTQQPSEKFPANTVILVHETGYMIGERVLRPAKVIVSSGNPS